MTRYCYLNGQIIPEDKAAISIDDIGLLRGFAVFDLLRTYNGKPFLLDQHLNRLEKSATILDLKLPITQDEISQIIEQLLKMNEMTEANIRLMLTGGKTISGLNFDPANATFAIILEDQHPLPETLYETGAKLLTREYLRSFAEAKHSNYILAVRMQKQLKAAGALEVLYTNKGLVLETGTSNFFIVKRNTIITAKDDILIGMTRNFVLDLARPHYQVEEREIILDEALAADEAFITATNKEIVPIVQIDDCVIGEGKVGSVTTKLMKLFAEKTR